MRPLVRAAALALTVSLALGPNLARAGDAGGPVAARRLATAKGLYGNLAYAKALRAYRRALKARDLTGPQRFQALLGEGWCLVILGQGRMARRALAEALTLNPGWSAPPDLSPKLAGAVQAARAGLHLSPVSLALSAPAGAPGELVITARDPGHRIHRVVLSVRLPGGAWQTPAVSRRGEGHFVAKVPGGAGQAVDAAVTAENAAGFAIAHAGSRAAPKMLALPGPPKAEASPAAHGAHGELAVAPPPASHPAAAHRAPPGATASTAAHRAPPGATAPPAPHPGHGLMLAGWIAGGAGVVALGAGTLFEVQAQNEAALYNGDPTKLGSSTHAQQVGAAAVAHAQLATGLFIGGGALAVAGGVLLLVGHGQAAPASGPDAALSVAPVPGGAMVVAAGRLPF